MEVVGHSAVDSVDLLALEQLLHARGGLDRGEVVLKPGQHRLLDVAHVRDHRDVGQRFGSAWTVLFEQ